MNCTCRNLTRVSHDDLKGFDHHSSCALHTKERYVRVSLESSSYVITLDELNTLVSEIKESEGENFWSVETIYMSVLEFNRLKEFQGH